MAARRRWVPPLEAVLFLVVRSLVSMFIAAIKCRGNRGFRLNREMHMWGPHSTGRFLSSSRLASRFHLRIAREGSRAVKESSNKAKDNRISFASVFPRHAGLLKRNKGAPEGNVPRGRRCQGHLDCREQPPAPPRSVARSRVTESCTERPVTL